MGRRELWVLIEKGKCGNVGGFSSLILWCLVILYLSMSEAPLLEFSGFESRHVSGKSG